MPQKYWYNSIEVFLLAKRRQVWSFSCDTVIIWQFFCLVTGFCQELDPWLGLWAEREIGVTTGKLHISHNSPLGSERDDHILHHLSSSCFRILLKVSHKQLELRRHDEIWEAVSKSSPESVKCLMNQAKVTSGAIVTSFLLLKKFYGVILWSLMSLPSSSGDHTTLF